MNSSQTKNPQGKIQRKTKNGRLAILAAQSRQMAQSYQELLSTAERSRREREAVSLRKQPSYIRVLSSVATTEALEKVMLEPLLDSCRRSRLKEAVSYLRTHAEDEERHKNALVRYLKEVYQFEKRRRTWLDQLIYDRAYVQLSRLFVRKPVYGLALIHAYEKFSIDFYDQLRKSAERDGAEELVKLISLVIKDERRHIAGMAELIGRMNRNVGGAGIVDRAAIYAILNLAWVDVDMRRWAWHNREIRRHLLTLGWDLKRLNQAGRASLKLTRRICAGQSLKGTGETV